MTYSTKTSMHPLLQFIILLAITIGCIIAGSLAGGVIAGLLYGSDAVLDIARGGTGMNTKALWILQIAGTTLPLFAAPVIFAFAVGKQPVKYLKTVKTFPVLLVMVFFIMFSSAGVIELLANINRQILSLDFLHGFAGWAKDKEDAAREMIETMLVMDNVGKMLFNLLFVGLFTAIAEEFLFRGCVQTIFKQWTRNSHAAVWITAILFSAFHMQFFGFLPRVMLGVLFGYMVAWSGSIWPAVWAHFVNNGTAVVATYMYQNKKIKINPDDEHIFNYTAYIVSLIFVLFLLWVYKKIASGKNQAPGY